MAKGLKTGGRQKGTPNVITKEVRETLKAIMVKELENLPGLMEQLEPKDRAELLTKMLPYVLPKVSSVDASYGEGFQADWD